MQIPIVSTSIISDFHINIIKEWCRWNILDDWLNDFALSCEVYVENKFVTSREEHKLNFICRCAGLDGKIAKSKTKETNRKLGV